MDKVMTAKCDAIRARISQLQAQRAARPGYDAFDFMTWSQWEESQEIDRLMAELDAIKGE